MGKINRKEESGRKLERMREWEFKEDSLRETYKGMRESKRENLEKKKIKKLR